MKMTIKETENNILQLNDSLDMIGSQIKWILTETSTKNMIPESPVGREMIQRFFSLYRDFKRLREKASEFYQKIHTAEFDDMIDYYIYTGIMQITMERFNEGVFHQFDCVAETGKLPKE